MTISDDINKSTIWKSPLAIKIWLWCNISATRKPQQIIVKQARGEQVINLDKGQFHYSRKRVATETNISPHTADRWIKHLQTIGWIDISHIGRKTIITLTNGTSYDTKNSAKQQPQPQNEDYAKFIGWIAKHAPAVAKMPRPFTEQEYAKLRTKWIDNGKINPRQLTDVLLDMENWSKLNTKKSAYLTLNKWLSMRYD